ncbi:MAG TPA: efflux transporter periplasmic adaptor subunit, partial [Methylomirabilota bacterium]|nr:efflux transporter periplasmic adaptor subunit [Methylomirabilota bacterium]
MRRSTIPAVLIVAIAAAGAVWWWRYGVATPVTVREATTGTAAEVVYASGNVEPRSWAKVTSLVSERIVEVCDDCEGETV